MPVLIHAGNYNGYLTGEEADRWPAGQKDGVDGTCVSGKLPVIRQGALEYVIRELDDSGECMIETVRKQTDLAMLTGRMGIQIKCMLHEGQLPEKQENRQHGTADLMSR